MAFTGQGEAQEGQVRKRGECMMKQEEKGRTTQRLQRDLKKWILGWQGGSSMSTPVPFLGPDGIGEKRELVKLSSGLHMCTMACMPSPTQ